MDDKLIAEERETRQSQPWNAGRIIALVASVLLAVAIPALGLAAGAVGAWMNRSRTQVWLAFAAAGVAAILWFLVTGRPFGIT